LFESQECEYHKPDYTPTYFDVPEGSRILGFVDENFEPIEPEFKDDMGTWLSFGTKLVIG